MNYEKQLNDVSQSLSDFQGATVDYLFQRMYEDGQNRMLVADEVGLGKTWIAKGLVAKAYSMWQQKESGGKKQFNVYYICSNQACNSEP